MSTMTSGETGYGIFWTEAMNQLEEELSEQEFAMWFNRMDYIRSDDTRIVVAVPSSFYRDQVKQRYLPVIEEKLFELSGSKLAIEFEIKKSDAPGDTSGNGNGSATRAASKATPGSTGSNGSSRAGGASASTADPAPKRKAKRPHESLKREYTFDTFVVGQNNSFAANAAMAIARNPGTAYNPCLVYGGV
ncbi:MAG: DnaA ATPase domain-containing protein, partial [Spirochaetota bacterium]